MRQRCCATKPAALLEKTTGAPSLQVGWPQVPAIVHQGPLLFDARETIAEWRANTVPPFVLTSSGGPNITLDG